MKSKLVKSGLFAAIVIFMLCLAGCTPASDGYVEINNEKLELGELSKLIGENQLIIKDDYIGKDITIVAPFVSIEGKETSTLDSSSETPVMLERPLGEVVIGTNKARFHIQITEENRDTAASPKDGDTVKATGVFSAYNDPTKAIYLLTFDDFTPQDTIQPSIEVVEG